MNDTKRGGDIDLLIKPEVMEESAYFRNKISFLNLLEKELGEQKIDIVIQAKDDERSIIKIAQETGIKL